MIEIHVGATRVPEKLLNRTAKSEFDMDRGNTNNSLCNGCERSFRGECPWHKRFEPVPGWKAEPCRHAAGAVFIDSFEVKECPLFQSSFEPVKIVKRIVEAKIKGTKQKVHEKIVYVRRWPIRAKDLDDEGCIQLMTAVVERARIEYICYPRERAQITKWLKSSAWFTNPEYVIKQLKDQARIVDLHPEKKQQILAKMSDEEWEKRVEANKHRESWVVYYSEDGEPVRAECEKCGYEPDDTEYLPRECPGCGSHMKKSRRKKLLRQDD